MLSSKHERRITRKVLRATIAAIVVATATPVVSADSPVEKSKGVLPLLPVNVGPYKSDASTGILKPEADQGLGAHPNPYCKTAPPVADEISLVSGQRQPTKLKLDQALADLLPISQNSKSPAETTAAASVGIPEHLWEPPLLSTDGTVELVRPRTTMRLRALSSPDHVPKSRLQLKPSGAVASPEPDSAPVNRHLSDQVRLPVSLSLSDKSALKMSLGDMEPSSDVQAPKRDSEPVTMQLSSPLPKRKAITLTMSDASQGTSENKSPNKGLIIASREADLPIHRNQFATMPTEFIPVPTAEALPPAALAEEPRPLLKEVEKPKSAQSAFGKLFRGKASKPETPAPMEESVIASEEALPVTPEAEIVRENAQMSLSLTDVEKPKSAQSAFGKLFRVKASKPETPAPMEESVIASEEALPVTPEAEIVRENAQVSLSLTDVEKSNPESAAKQMGFAVSRPTVISMDAADVKPLTLDGSLKHFRIENPSICQVLSVGSSELRIIGQMQGQTRLMVWLESTPANQPLRYQVNVQHLETEADKLVQTATQLNRVLAANFAASDVEVSVSSARLVVTGQVADDAQARQILQLIRKACLVPVVDQLLVR
ncbi:hypothetical protein FF011L_00570 [Roseimaritima multifibrata]|uniref:Pilus formation protein N-terminal domain-containing protein n=1 Tax=Roseimaritima multifibrata TaxID=1930274 RepID=A0A517M8V5_9BACT|nr:pilus assembly protein N-terminal domain-containing protein [Roseimaritima multifibrata]QDS91328.1 hypothetical protein FF011L_00570 [Roseimaritima multifibrata]